MSWSLILQDCNESLGDLFFIDHFGAADLLHLQVDGYFNAVGDPDEWNSTIHSEVFAIEGHRSLNRA